MFEPGSACVESNENQSSIISLSRYGCLLEFLLHHSLLASKLIVLEFETQRIFILILATHIRRNEATEVKLQHLLAFGSTGSDC